MKPYKAYQKKHECQTHREIQYGKALDGLIAGKVPPEYVAKRFSKLKEIRK